MSALPAAKQLETSVPKRAAAPGKAAKQRSRGLAKTGSPAQDAAASGVAAQQRSGTFGPGDPVWLALPNPRPSPLTTLAPEIHVPATVQRMDGPGHAICESAYSGRHLRAPLAQLRPRKPGEIAPGKRGRL